MDENIGGDRRTPYSLLNEEDQEMAVFSADNDEYDDVVGDDVLLPGAALLSDDDDDDGDDPDDPDDEGDATVDDDVNPSGEEQPPRPSRLDTAGVLSRITYHWVTPLIKAGYRKPLELRDLDALSREDNIPTLSEAAQVAWEEYRPPQADEGGVAMVGDHDVDGDDDDDDDALQGSDVLATADASPWPVLQTVWSLIRRPMMIAFIPQLVSLVFSLTSPLLASAFIEWISDANAPRSTGYALVVAFAVVEIVRLLNAQYFWFIVDRQAMRTTIYLNSLVYEKSLRLGGVDKGSANTLMNVDPQKVSRMVWGLHPMWSMPIRLLVSIILLYRWMGSAAIVAAVVAMVLMPVNYWGGKWLFKSKDKAMALQDKRVKVLTEILNGILVVKLFSWEDFVRAKIGRVRAREVKHLTKFAQTLAVVMFVILTTSSLMSVATFATYALQGHALTAAIIFPSLSLFQGMMWPILILPDMMTRFSDARTSARRLTAYLSAPELPVVERTSDAGINAHIVLNDASFAFVRRVKVETSDDEDADEADGWNNGDPHPDLMMGEADTSSVPLLARVGEDGRGDRGSDAYGVPGEAKFTLRDLSLSMRLEASAGSQVASRGRLLAVIGRVGAGKSSLLRALLGEMHLLHGKASVRGSVAYVPQQAWIRNASVRENILFGRPMQRKRYLRVLRACCLSDDLRMLPHGDRTLVGEKGIGLSGGQKARLSLARAVYADKDIYALDDPLSAVDAHVGNHIFHKCIRKLLSRKLVILVTHQLQYVHLADQVAVMELGRIQQVGSFQDLARSGIDFAAMLNAGHGDGSDTVPSRTDVRTSSSSVPHPAPSHVAWNLIGHNAVPPVAGGGAPSGQLPPLLSFPGDGGDDEDASVVPASVGSPVGGDHLAAGPSIRRSDVGWATGLRSTAVTDQSVDQSWRHYSAPVPSEFLAPQAGGRSPSHLVHNDLAPRSPADCDVAASERASGVLVTSTGSAGSTDLGAYEEEMGSSLVFGAGAELALEEDERYTGDVKSDVYTWYFRQMGSMWAIALAGVISVSFQLFTNAVEVWLAHWADQEHDGSSSSSLSSSAIFSSSSSSSSSSGGDGTAFYLSVYVTFAIAASLCALSRQILWLKMTLKAARDMHDRLLFAVIRAPMSFFHTTPTGRIITRFSKDQGMVDTWLPDILSDTVLCILSIFGTMIVITRALPWFLLALVPIGIVYWIIMQYYRKSNVETGRLQSATASPIYAFFSESLDGLESIRAYGAQGDMVTRIQGHISDNIRAYFSVAASSRWLGVRIEGVAVLVLLFVTLVCAFTRGTISPGLVGLALAYAGKANSDMNWFVRSVTSLESDMSKVERIRHFSQTESEAPLEADDGNGLRKAPATWPEAGHISFDGIVMRYNASSDPVLRGVTFEVRPREKIGIVGRTGAGKSSLTNALFRLVEIEDGAIRIDGVDIGGLGLSQLRSNLSIVPQDPVLYSGTLRFNLDPSCLWSDDDVWDALRRVHISDFVSTLPGGLDTPVTENGANFSVGQRQILCLARAVLRQSKILVLDEATASVDSETDAIIQQTVREVFADVTVLTIAHRLDTIMDSDRVLVMQAGQVAEYGSPSDLLDAKGLFYDLVQDTGDAAKELEAMARQGKFAILE